MRKRAFRGCLIVLIFFLGADLGQAESKRLHRRQSVHSKPETNPSPRPQTLSKEEARGTDQSPVAVKVISTPDAKAENAEERERRITHEANEQSLSDYTRLLAYGTFGLALVAAIQAGLFVWQLGYMRKGLVDAKVSADAARDAANAAKDSAEIARTSMISGDRAYVYHSGCRWISHALLESARVFWRIRPIWVNSGNTPTRQLRVYAHYILQDSRIDENYQFIPDMLPEQLTYISPKRQIESESRDFFGDDLIAVQEGRKYLYIWGVARYFDVFPGTTEHVTKFCVEAKNITGNPMEGWSDTNKFDIVFSTFDRHNCADDECGEPN